MKEKFALWNALFIHYLRRDWKKIIGWIIGIGLFSSVFVPPFVEISKGQGLIGMFETMQNPAMISMVGPTPVVSGDYTIGAMYSNMMLLFCGLFAMIISVLHVTSHTRKEEDLGLTELIRSFRVGRQANSLAVMIEVIIINMVLALIIGVIMMSFRADSVTAQGSLLFGASVGSAGIIGGSIALLMAQLMPSSSGATGAALSVVGLLYILRAGSDVSNASLSKINPLGWTYLTYPFTENNWHFLLYSIMFVLVIMIIAFILEGRRDMGAGYLPERQGRGEAKSSLLSVHGLLLKVNKGVMIGWLITFFVLGVAYGSIYGDMESFVESNDLISQMFAHAGYSLEESFTGMIMMIMIMLVAVLPIVIVNKLFGEETRRHLSQIYATRVTKGQLYWTTLVLAAIAGVAGIFLAAGGLGGTALAVMSDDTQMTLRDFIVSGCNFFPSILFFIGLAALALGWMPKLGKLVYAYLGYVFAVNYFSGILDLPEWLSKTAVLSWIPR